MNCLACKDLDRVFESRLAEYLEARSAAFYRVSTEIAAKREVDMERAKTAQQEHQSVCPSARKVDPGDRHLQTMSRTRGPAQQAMRADDTVQTVRYQ